MALNIVQIERAKELIKNPTEDVEIIIQYLKQTAPESVVLSDLRSLNSAIEDIIEKQELNERM